jgi:selenocysteine lyase/cysteine desulfurase
MDSGLPLFAATVLIAKLCLTPSRSEKKKYDDCRNRRKQEFLRVSVDDYGYAGSEAGFIDGWRHKELPELISPIPANKNSQGLVYLDYAGAALAVPRQLTGMELNMSVLANPHSSGPVADKTTNLLGQAKLQVLSHFCGPDHHDWDLVFTAGATSALQIVAEHFPFTPSRLSPPWRSEDSEDVRPASRFVYAKNAHTSVVGMRGPCESRGAVPICLSLDSLHALSARAVEQGGGNERVTLQPAGVSVGKRDREVAHLSCSETDRVRSAVPRVVAPTHSLLCLPLECNFSGRLADIAGVAAAAHHGTMDEATGILRKGPPTRRLSKSATHRWWVLADVAKAAASGPVSLPG